MFHRERQRTTIYDINFKPIVKAHIMNTAVTRDIGQLRWAHTLRVTKLATKLAEYIPDKVDIRKVKMMCILHDMYKYIEYDEDCHGYMVSKYLDDILRAFVNEMDENEKKGWCEVSNALALHSDKDSEEARECNPYLALLQDADVLDKLSIGWIWQTNRIFASDEPVEVTANYYKDKVDQYVGGTPGYHDLYNKAVKILENTSWSDRKMKLSKKWTKQYGVIKKGDK